MSTDLDLALQHHRAGRRTEAEARYRQVLLEDPNHPGALYGLGTLALQSEQYATAADLIRRAIAAQGDWPEAYYHLGLSLQGLGKFQSAIVAFRRAVALNPQLFEAQLNLAVCLQISGQGNGAIAAFQRAVEIKGDDPLTLLNFAIALRGGGKIDEAIANARKAVEIKSDFAEAWLQLGKMLREKDLPEEASEAYARRFNSLQTTSKHPRHRRELYGPVGESMLRSSFSAASSRCGPSTHRPIHFWDICS